MSPGAAADERLWLSTAADVALPESTETRPGHRYHRGLIPWFHSLRLRCPQQVSDPSITSRSVSVGRDPPGKRFNYWSVCGNAPGLAFRASVRDDLGGWCEERQPSRSSPCRRSHRVCRDRCPSCTRWVLNDFRRRFSRPGIAFRRQNYGA